MEWRVGDLVYVLRVSEHFFRQHDQLVFGRRVCEVSPEYVTLRRLGGSSLSYPTERVKRSQMEIWWKEGKVRIMPHVKSTGGALTGMQGSPGKMGFESDWWQEYRTQDRPGYICDYCGHVSCGGDCEATLEAIIEDEMNVPTDEAV